MYNYVYKLSFTKSLYFLSYMDTSILWKAVCFKINFMHAILLVGNQTSNAGGMCAFCDLFDVLYTCISQFIRCWISNFIRCSIRCFI